MLQKLKNLFFGQPASEQPEQQGPTAEDITIMRMLNLKRMNYDVVKQFMTNHKETYAYLRSNYALNPVEGDERITQLCKAYEVECYPTILANAKQVYGIGPEGEQQFEASFYRILFANLPEDYRIGFKIESEIQG